MTTDDHLPLLDRFLSRLLDDTRRVKTALRLDCQQARFALKPWELATTVQVRVDESRCTCDKECCPLENQAEEIAAGIEKALSQSKQLREKLTQNLAKEKKRRQADAATMCPRNVYKAAVAPSAKKPLDSGLLSSKQRNSPGNREEQAANAEKQSSSREDSKSPKIPQVPAVSMIKAKSPADRKLLKTSPCNAAATKPSKKAKDFIAANKLSVKHAGQKITKENSKSELHLPLEKADEKSAESSCRKVPELNALIEKISLESNSRSMSRPDLNSRDCPFHEESEMTFVEQRRVATIDAIDAIEGIQRFGVPVELMAVSKTYDSYLKGELSDGSVVDRKNDKAKRAFLSRLRHFNEITRSRDGLGRLSEQYASLLRDVFNGRAEPAKFAELDVSFATLGIQHYQHYQRQEAGKSESRDSSVDIRAWRSNGIWNDACISNFDGMAKAHCIRYSGDDQLKTLYELAQELQRQRYKGDLLGLLLRVIPRLRENLKATSKEYAEAYKMLATLSQDFNPRTPVLVRTDV